MNIYDHEYTISELKKGKSISRFGDGELHLINTGSISSQIGSPALRKRLLEVLNNDNENMCVAVYVPKKQKKWGKMFASFVKDPTVFYHDALISRNRDPKLLLGIIDLWKNKNVIIVNHTNDPKWHSITRNAKSTRFVQCKSLQAFSEYDDLLRKTMETVNAVENACVIIAAGACGTVLAYDLCLNGVQALDLGRFHMKFDKRFSKYLIK